MGSFSLPASDAGVAALAGASGDTDRPHPHADHAARTRLGEQIAHGTLVAGVISAALARLPGLVISLSQDASFPAAVVPGDRVTAECTVVEQVGESRFRLATEALVDGETTVDDLQ